jgi:hypothetical protein
MGETKVLSQLGKRLAFLGMRPGMSRWLGMLGLGMFREERKLGEMPVGFWRLGRLGRLRMFLWLKVRNQHYCKKWNTKLTSCAEKIVLPLIPSQLPDFLIRSIQGLIHPVAS